MRGVRILVFLTSILIAGLAVAIIGYLNFELIRFHFVGDFNQNIASIETSYIQMAKFWVESGGAGWQPLWYLGYPWHVFYTPVLPALEVMLHNFAGFSFAHAYRVITGIGYILTPISTFFFVWQISKSKSGAFIAALTYTLAPSLMSLIFHEVSEDTISNLLEPRRYTILVRWGEGPHTLALAFLPLYGVFLSRYLEGRRFGDMFLAALFLGFIAMTNAIPLWAGILLTVAFFLGKLAEAKPLNSGKKLAKPADVAIVGQDELSKWLDGVDFVKIFKGIMAIFAVAYGLIAFWYNPQFIGTFFAEGSGAFSNWAAMFPWGILIFVLLAVLLFAIVKKLFGSVLGLSFAIFWFLMVFGLVFVYYASGDSRLEYVPQVLRLNTEADLSVSILIGVLVSRLFLFLVGMEGYRKIVGFLSAAVVLAVPLLILGIWGSKLLGVLPQHTKPIEASKIRDISNTAEYRVGKKLRELTEGTGERVFAPGNYGFWLNFFEPVPQIRGGLYQSSVHSWPDHIYWQVVNGTDSNIALAWFKIANIGKLVFTTGASAETYKDYKVPKEKFDKVLVSKFSESGDIYYDVPLKNNILAKVVESRALAHLKKPFNAIDDEAIFQYVEWMERYSDRRLNVSVIKQDHFRIWGDVSEGESVLFQMSHDPGWSVEVKKGLVGPGKWKVVRDPLDFIVLVPEGEGSFEIDLVWRRPLVVYFGYLVSFITLVLIIKRIFAPNLSFDWRMLRR